MQQIPGARRAFATILDSGAVVTCDNADASVQVPEQLQNVQQVQAARGAFSTILGFGAIVTWGDPRLGGDSSQVQEQLTCSKIAAILDSGAVVMWGNPDGVRSQVQEQLPDVQQINASLSEPHCLGSGVAWRYHHKEEQVLKQWRTLQHGL